MTSDDLHIYESKYILRAHVENEIKSMAYQYMLWMKAKSIDPGGFLFFDSHENVEYCPNKRFFLKSKDVDKTKVGD